MVVFARRNATAPEMAVATPARANAIAATRRIGVDTSVDVVNKEIPHIIAAMSSATTGGGISSSSECIT